MGFRTGTNYARNGFSNFSGCMTGWGYWASAWLGNLSYLVLIFATLGYFFPVFGAGNNLPSIMGASLLLWGMVAVVLRGVGQAAIVASIATVAKILPIIIFIAIMILSFNLPTFQTDFWGVDGFAGVV